MKASVFILRVLLLIALLSILLPTTYAQQRRATKNQPHSKQSQPIPFESNSQHTNNWAVIVSTSKYWFNYRHNSDALSIYHLIKRQGIPDSNIILMLPEDVACTTKNVIPATVYNSANIYERQQKGEYNKSDYFSTSDDHNLYNEEQIEIDYKGDDVTVENFLRVLTGRHLPHTPRNKRLLSNSQSNLFIYLSGHGGDQFLKFRDTEILTAPDLAFAIQEAYVQNRFHRAFLIVETCQAATMAENIQTPGVITSTSSKRGENSYSHGVDTIIGASIVDKYTYFLHQYYDNTDGFKDTSIRAFLDMFTFRQLQSNHVYRTELYEYDVNTGEQINSAMQGKILDFFGASHDFISTKNGKGVEEHSLNYERLRQGAQNLEQIANNHAKTAKMSQNLEILKKNADIYSVVTTIDGILQSLILLLFNNAKIVSMIVGGGAMIVMSLVYYTIFLKSYDTASL